MRDLINLVEGRNLEQHPGFQTWFAGSKAVLEDGSPQVCYHGTFEDFAEFAHISPNRRSYGFNRLGFWFDTDPRTPEYFAGYDQRPFGSGPHGVIMPCYLSVKKPLYMDSEGLWGEDAEKLQLFYDMRQRHIGGLTRNGLKLTADIDGQPFDMDLFRRLGDEVRVIERNYEKTDGWHRLMAHLPNGVKSKDHEVDEFKAAMIAEGYDGIYISDTLADHGSRNYTTTNWWVVFHPNQIKSAFARNFDGSSSDIRN